jgi:hypothetical protein
MSKPFVAAITVALQCVCAGSWRRLGIAAAGLAAAVLVAGCGGSTSTTSSTSAEQSPARTSTATAPPRWSGMGAPLTAFAAAHPLQEGGGQAGGYGSSTSYPGAGQCCEFVELSTTGPPDNRVDGYTQAFAIGTAVAAAKLEVLALMPSDTTTTAFFFRHDSSGHTCGVWNVQSPILGKWFSTKQVEDPQGVIRIELSTLNTQQVFSASNVTQAVIGTGAAGHKTNC